MWRWLRSLTFRAPSGPPALRPVEPRIVDPYRAEPPALPLERVVEPCTLGQVLTALGDAELAVHRCRRGFDVLDATGARMMPVRVPDPQRISPDRMACGTDAPELLLDLALAVVPLFGPMLAEIPFAGSLLVDGTRDRAALGEEAAQRIQQVGRRIATRAPISFPILIDLARRMRQPR